MTTTTYVKITVIGMRSSKQKF